MTIEDDTFLLPPAGKPRKPKVTHLETVTEDELSVGTWKYREGFASQWNGSEWIRVVSFNDLIRICREDTAVWFPQVKDDLTHMVLALNEEAGEVAGALKKGQRGSVNYDKAIKNLGDETVDVLIYLCNIWGILGIDPIEIFEQIRVKNAKRFGGK